MSSSTKSTRRDVRAGILASCGAGAPEIEELLAYNDSPFDHARLPEPLRLPLPPEPHVRAWQGYAEEAARIGAFATLARRLPQLRFPIRAGISQTDPYRAATRRGAPPDDLPEATGLRLKSPESLRLVVHRGAAGPVPVLIAGERQDFVSLVQALGRRNEPRPVPASMGASIVTGFNNWDRIRAHRRRWQAQDPASRGEAAWAAELRRLSPRKALYQDRFIILSDGPYSDVPAADLGLADDEWRRASLTIRLEHECAHYFTLRLFGVARDNALDELLADYAGIVAAAGRYRADWFLRFMGLEAFPAFRASGRLRSYRGRPPLSDGAFRVLQALLERAARNLERFDAAHAETGRTPTGRARVLLGLTRLTLEELAAPGAISRLEAAATVGKLTFRRSPARRHATARKSTLGSGYPERDRENSMDEQQEEGQRPAAEPTGELADADLEQAAGAGITVGGALTETVGRLRNQRLMEEEGIYYF